jgi:hypothetical protein
MNRKEFLKSLGLGTASLFIIPAVIKSDNRIKAKLVSDVRMVTEEEWEDSDIEYYQQKFGGYIIEAECDCDNPGPGNCIFLEIKNSYFANVYDSVISQREIIGVISNIDRVFNTITIYPINVKESFGKIRKGDLFAVIKNAL